MTEFIFIYILLIHFLGDFALQSHEQAQNKSLDIGGKYNIYLLMHVSVYSGVWLIAMLPILGFWSIVFAAITFVFHYWTDYITSRLSKPFFGKGDYHNGFVVVGADQILHYLQLYYTLKIFI